MILCVCGNISFPDGVHVRERSLTLSVDRIGYIPPHSTYKEMFLSCEPENID